MERFKEGDLVKIKGHDGLSKVCRHVRYISDNWCSEDWVSDNWIFVETDNGPVRHYYSYVSPATPQEIAHYYAQEICDVDF